MGPLVLPAIGLGINLLSNIFGAKKQASAAKDAAAMQAASADRAMGLMTQAYAPYLNAGASSMNVLSRLMTPGVPYAPPMQAQDAMMPPAFGQPPMNMAVPRGAALGRVLTMPQAPHRRIL